MFVTAYHTYIRTRPTTPTFIFSSGKETETWRTKKLVIVVVVVVFSLLRTGMEPRKKYFSSLQT